MIAMTHQNTTTMITEDEAREIYPNFRYDDLPVFVGDIVLHTIHKDDQETEWDMNPIDCTETKGTIKLADKLRLNLPKASIKLTAKAARKLRR